MEKSYNFVELKGFRDAEHISVQKSDLTQKQKDFLLGEAIHFYNNLPNELKPKFKATIKKSKTFLSEFEKQSIYEILEYLNKKIGTQFKPTGTSSIKLIKARLNDGFTVDDFYKVIDTKVKDWALNEEMKIYLRPETLFGNKFESYLEQSRLKKSSTTTNNGMVY